MPLYGDACVLAGLRRSRRRLKVWALAHHAASSAAAALLIYFKLNVHAGDVHAPLNGDACVLAGLRRW